MKNTFSIIVVLLLVAVIFFFLSIAAVEQPSESELFVIERGASVSDVVDKLYEKGFIGNKWFFHIILKLKSGSDIVESGGYEIAKGMSSWKIAEILTGTLEMKWVFVPEGLRKEEVVEIIGSELNWSAGEKRKFIGLL